MGAVSWLITFGVIAALVAWYIKRRNDYIKAGLPLPPAPKKPGSKSKAKKEEEEAEAANLTPLTIYFGTQTGTAERYGKQLAVKGRKLGFNAKAVSVSSLKPTTLEAGGLAIFLMATYGEGDPTDDAVEFTKWLTEAADAAKAAAAGAAPVDGSPVLSYSKLKFTVFGLGNKLYEHYNKMGKIVDQRLEELGGARVYRHGEGDDNDNLEDDFENWEADLWPALEAAVPSRRRTSSATAADVGGASEADLPPMPWMVSLLPAGTPEAHLSVAAKAAAADKAAVSNRHFFTSLPLRVVENRELRQRPGVGESTRHMEFDILDDAMHYVTADNLYVCPHNPADVVASAARSLRFNLDDVFVLNPRTTEDAATAQPLVPSPVSVRTLLTQYVDLCGQPHKDLLRCLAVYAKNADERARLVRLASREGRDEFTEWVVRQQRSVLEVLIAFPSLDVPLEAFIHIAPALQPRAYTIASSSIVQPRRIALVQTVVDAPKPGDAGRRLQGVCTNYLAGCKAGDIVHGYVKTSTFRLPTDASKPVIMVGPGTGIAPMRAFMQERQAAHAAGLALGHSTLYFGCRTSETDYIYAEELDAYVRDGSLSCLHVAFSREKADKVYVQHLVEVHGKRMAKELLEDGAHVYVCGAIRMGNDVMAAFERVLVAHGGMTAAAAREYVEAMVKQHRYVQELWS